MNDSRRDFMRRASMLVAALGASALPSWEAASAAPPDGTEPEGPTSTGAPAPPKKIKHGTIIGPGKYVEKGETKHVLSIVDLDAKVSKARLAKLDFFAHGVSPHPARPTFAVLFEKHGKGCCEVDLARAEMTRPIPTAEEREFYGHGAFSRDGAVMYCTEVVLADRRRGVIVIRDGKTYEPMGEFPSFGTAPHDCKLIDDGATLMITNGGSGKDDESSPPSVTFVDVKTQKLLEKLEFETPRINAGHLAITSARDVAVASAMREGLPADAPGGLSLRSQGGTLKTMKEPAEVVARMKGETLSVAIHEPSGTVGVTNPDGDLVTFWSLREGKFLKEIALKKVRGIALTLTSRFFAVSFTEESGIAMQLIDANKLELVPSAKLERSFLSGSHMIVYPLAV